MTRSDTRLEKVLSICATYLEPLAFLLGQHDLLDHLRLYGDTSETLESEPDVTVELPFGLDFGDCEGGFEADSEFAFGVCGRAWKDGG